MQKVVISVLGADRPGIVAAVSRVLYEHGCNIEDVNQTILQTEFAGIFVASTPKDLDATRLQAYLQAGVQHMGLQVLVKGGMLALVLAGHLSGRVQIGQTMALTVIVADTIVSVVALALAVQVRRQFGTLDLQALSTLRR